MTELRVRRAAVLDSMDSDEMTNGYLAAFDNKECPKDASFSFRHGWNNGATDKGKRAIDAAQRELAHDVVETGYLRKFTASFENMFEKA